VITGVILCPGAGLSRPENRDCNQRCGQRSGVPPLGARASLPAIAPLENIRRGARRGWRMQPFTNCDYWLMLRGALQNSAVCVTSVIDKQEIGIFPISAGVLDAMEIIFRERERERQRHRRAFLILFE
jgi:hypothetical protein